MLTYSSEFQRGQRRAMRIATAVLAATTLAACFLAASHFDFKDAQAAAVATPPALAAADCRPPEADEVLHVRRLREEEGPGFLCTYYTNVGYGRKSRVDRRETWRAVKTARAG